MLFQYLNGLSPIQIFKEYQHFQFLSSSLSLFHAFLSFCLLFICNSIFSLICIFFASNLFFLSVLVSFLFIFSFNNIIYPQTKRRALDLVDSWRPTLPYYLSVFITTKHHIQLLKKLLRINYFDILYLVVLINVLECQNNIRFIYFIHYFV